MQKTQLVTLALAFLACTAFAQQQQAKNPTPASQPVQAQVQLKTQADSNQYILGAYLGQYIAGNGFSITNAELFIKGMNDALGNKPLLVPAEMVSAKIAEYQTKLTTERNILLEKQLFESLKKQAGMGMFPDGVYYGIIKSGNGKRPLASDSVVLQVRGYLPDGKLFEDTYKKNAPYRVTPSGLIPGLNEAVQFMTPGSLWKIFIPSTQAFGEKGLQGVIPPHSAVIFEVELLEVK